MPIENNEAVEIARARGLSLHDAAALAQMAGTIEEAERIADAFKAPLSALEQAVADLTDDERAAARHMRLSEADYAKSKLKLNAEKE
jgi:hypothetical protein